MARFQEADPRTIGPYRVVRLLGAGGMGRVYLGVDADGAQAAVKIVNADLLRDEQFRKRFTREAAATAAVSGRFIAGIVGSDLDGPEPWLATEYIDGPALSTVVTELGPLAPARAQEIAAGLAEALTTIHAAGLVHRDVKPANVLLAAHGPHLIDFGIARDAAASTITRTGVVVGTPPYMAPEQIRGHRTIGPPADVFALGGVLSFAITGRHPFGEGDATALAYRIAHEEPDLDGVDDAVIRELISACLAKAADERPSAAEVQRLLGEVATRAVVAGVVGPAVGPVVAVDTVPEEPEEAAEEPELESAEPEVSAGPVVAEDPAAPKEPAAPAVAEPEESAAITRAGRRRRTIAALTALLIVAGAGVLGSALMRDGGKNSPRASGPVGGVGSGSGGGADRSGGGGAVSSGLVSATSASSASSGTAPSGTPASSGKPSPALTPSTTPPPAPSPTGPSTVIVVSNQPSTIAVTTRITSSQAHTTTPPPKPPTTKPPVSHSSPHGSPPPAPTNGNATATMNSDYSGRTVTFSWSPSSGATSYQIHLTTYPAVDETFSVGSAHSYQHAYQGYEDVCFQVRAVNAYGVSAWDSSSPHCA